MLNSNIAFQGQLQIKDKNGTQKFSPVAVDPKVDQQDLMQLSLNTFIPGEVKERGVNCVKMADCTVTANKDGDQLIIKSSLGGSLESERTIDKKDLPDDNFHKVFDMFMKYVQDPTKEKVD